MIYNYNLPMSLLVVFFFFQMFIIDVLDLSSELFQIVVLSVTKELNPRRAACQRSRPGQR
jgi:hypothetical protein